MSAAPVELVEFRAASPVLLREVEQGMRECAFYFWRYLGFGENGERYTAEDLTSDVLILEKDLAPGA